MQERKRERGKEDGEGKREHEDMEEEGERGGVFLGEGKEEGCGKNKCW